MLNDLPLLLNSLKQLLFISGGRSFGAQPTCSILNFIEGSRNMGEVSVWNLKIGSVTF